jgi:NAD(P)-dependent dehydrogenase (short-subunit alcohol dehydrogenase family)
VTRPLAGLAVAILGAVSLAAGGALACGAGDAAPARDEIEMGGRDGSQPVILITGSTDGLGREVARRLAATGAHVIVHGRSEARGAALVEEIERSGRGSASFHRADFASLDQVRELAEAVLRDHDRLDVLINNAGIWLTDPPDRQLTADGLEAHFAVNYLAGFLLTHLLLPRLIESAPARIVNVASAAQRAIDFDDPMLARGYSPGRAYAQSKLAQVLFTIDLAVELEGRGVTAVSLHPATLMDTPMVRGAGARPQSTVAEGADAVLHLVTAPDLENGAYFDGRVQGRAHVQAYDAAARARLRALSRTLTGLD